MTLHMMIDLETMGTDYDAPIVAVGAAMFDPDRVAPLFRLDGEPLPRFYAAVSLRSALKHGRLDGDTLKFWLEQGDAARAAICKGTKALDQVLSDLADFYRYMPTPEPVCVWGNGATFDITLLEVSYRKLFDVKPPWGFRAVRDCRTINSLVDGWGLPDIPRPVTNTAHNALDDAIYQATWVSAQWKAIRLRGSRPDPFDRMTPEELARV